MATKGSNTSQFRFFFGEKPKIIGLLSEFRRIGYVTKQGNLKNQMKEKKSSQS